MFFFCKSSLLKASQPLCYITLGECRVFYHIFCFLPQQQQSKKPPTPSSTHALLSTACQRKHKRPWSISASSAKKPRTNVASSSHSLPLHCTDCSSATKPCPYKASGGSKNTMSPGAYYPNFSFLPRLHHGPSGIHTCLSLCPEWRV